MKRRALKLFGTIRRVCDGGEAGYVLLCVLFLAASATTVLFSGADYWVFFGLAVPGGLTLGALMHRDRQEALRLSITTPATTPPAQEDSAEQRIMNDAAITRGGGITKRKRIILQSSGIVMFVVGAGVWAVTFSAWFKDAVDSIFQTPISWSQFVVAVSGLIVGVVGVILLQAGERLEDSTTLT